MANAVFELPAMMTMSLNPRGVATFSTITGTVSAFNSTGSLSSLSDHSTRSLPAFSRVIDFSPLAQPVRCGSPPNVSQSAAASLAPVTTMPTATTNNNRRFIPLNQREEPLLHFTRDASLASPDVHVDFGSNAEL